MRKGYLSGPLYHLSIHAEEEQQRDSILLLLLNDGAEDLSPDAVELAQLQLSLRPRAGIPRRRRVLPPRRHLK